MDDKIAKKLLFECGQIDELIDKSTPLFNLCKIKAPDFVETTAVAQILHSFYNGIENMILLIIKHKDADVPRGMTWHSELLDRAFEPAENRTQIFRDELKAPLNEYRKFRHIVRHLYFYQFSWEKMEFNAKNLEDTWAMVKSDIETFVNSN